jgi:hypothetical protein
LTEAVSIVHRTTGHEEREAVSGTPSEAREREMFAGEQRGQVVDFHHLTEPHAADVKKRYAVAPRDRRDIRKNLGEE